MSTVSLHLDEIYGLAHDCLVAHGCDEPNAAAAAWSLTPAAAATESLSNPTPTPTNQALVAATTDETTDTTGEAR